MPTIYREGKLAGLNNAISGVGNVYLQKMLQEQQRKKQLEDTIELVKKKAEVEAQYNPDTKLMNELFDSNTTLLGNSGNIPMKNRINGGQESILGGVNLNKGMLLRGILSKKFGVPFEQMMSPEEKQTQLTQDVEKTQAQELAKGIPTSETGKVALARESIKNIQDIKSILFPTGEAKSFKRSTAFASNLPGGSLPILPSRGWGKAEQEIFRKMGAALSGRQLIQTGVAARPEETQKLISQFAPSGGSNPEAALNGLTELENFYKDYLNTLETRGIKNRFSGQSMQSQQQYQVGQTISKGGKQYQITGFDTDGEPLVDLVR